MSPALPEQPVTEQSDWDVYRVTFDSKHATFAQFAPIKLLLNIFSYILPHTQLSPLAKCSYHELVFVYVLCSDQTLLKASSLASAAVSSSAPRVRMSV